MFQNAANIVNVVSLSLAVVALGLAALQSRSARKHAQSLVRQSEALRFVTDSLSTRYLGPFPSYLVSVVDLIESAESDLLILVGNPLPAYFTAPSTFLNYHQAIQRKARSGVPVRMMCMDQEQRQRRLRLQFPSSRDEWDGWFPENRAKVADVLKYRFSDVDIETLDHDKFLEILANVQRDVLQQVFVFSGVSVLEVSQLVSLQVWVADRDKAVFSIQTSTASAMSYGLVTSDPLFVNALISMIMLYETAIRSPTGPAIRSVS